MEKTPIAEDRQRSIFVDNIITGGESREEALKYYEQANEIMGRANLPLQTKDLVMPP